MDSSIVVVLQVGVMLMLFAHVSDARVYRANIEPHWFAGNTRFWYRNDNRNVREFIVVDAQTGTRLPAFDHQDVARQIGDAVIEEIEFSDDGSRIKLIGSRRAWELDVATGRVNELDSKAALGTALKPIEWISPSRGGAESGIVFENRLSAEVELFWINYEGKRQSYGIIKAGERRDQHTFENHVWLITDENGEAIAAFKAESRPKLAIIDGNAPKPRVRRTESGHPMPTTVKSPDGKWEAFVREHRLWVRRLEDGFEMQLSDHGDSDNSFHRDAIRARAIGMRYDQPDYPESLPDVIWAPDSRKLIAIKTKVVPEPRVYLVESSPDDQLQPKLHSYPYIKPGDEIPTQQVYLFDVENGREIPIDNSSFPNPWSIDRFTWQSDSMRFWFLYNQRGHQVMRVISVTLPSGAEAPAEVKVIVDETSETFINYSNKTYLQIMEGTNELIWMSERDGWNHLYLYDLLTGEVKNRITRGEWVVRAVDRVDEKTRQIWFRAGGVLPDQDPYHIHYCRVNFDGTDLVVLTEGDGTHTIEWSPDRRWFIDRWSRVDLPPVHELRNAADGSPVCRLEEADADDVLKAGYRFPERFVAKGRDGVTDIYGIVHFPRDFDPSRRYPIIECIYAGPHGQHVPKSFNARYRGQQEIADSGFIVVQIDGMGTNWRSKRFHDVAWKNLKDAGFPDRIAWIKAAAETRPWMDISRVGIYGGSAGGQNAMRAVLDYPDFYKAAAADCGCHDNRMDKIWWNEAWMGWPVDESYIASSNVEDAHKLGGKLLLTVGELDKNVDPSSTYQVVNALQKAGKEFEFMLMIGKGHGAGESDYGRKLRIDFFLRHLTGD